MVNMFRLAALILLIDFHAVICKSEAVSDDFVLVRVFESTTALNSTLL